ncbi:hypothetical protein LJC57_01390 [Parabacteroides sp. OttesenSCG-928-G07]|nr:hypothetical protein [Parabacteroides sp. OttesenSCG-928-G07]
MELDDLKTGWTILNERLEENEILNKRIVEEMIKNRTNSAHSKLFRYDLCLLILVALLCVFNPIMWPTTILFLSSFLILEGLLLIALVVAVWKISYLLRFNLETKNICELNRLILRYRLILKWDYIFSIPFVFIALVAVFLIQGSNVLLNSWRLWVVGISLVVAVIWSILEIRFSNKAIASIEQGLKELKEFEEE